MTLTMAQALPLMGRAESWSGHGGQPLGALSDSVLLQARRFFSSCLREAKNARMEEQLEAIALVLADREAHSPQTVLGL